MIWTKFAWWFGVGDDNGLISWNFLTLLVCLLHRFKLIFWGYWIFLLGLEVISIGWRNYDANFCVQNCKLCKCFQQGHYEKVNLMISPTALLIYFVTFCWMLGDFAWVLHMVKKIPNHYYLNKTKLFFENLFFQEKLIHFITNFSMIGVPF